ncbi:hypothetical protein DIU36_27650 [Mucilaginibacter rubeus]|nr:hypothetical protein DIU36_27650 [Mucilaginibacter rubeus]
MLPKSTAMGQAGQSIVGDVRGDVGKVGDKGGEKEAERQEPGSQDQRSKKRRSRFLFKNQIVIRQSTGRNERPSEREILCAIYLTARCIRFLLTPPHAPTGSSK